MKNFTIASIPERNKPTLFKRHHTKTSRTLSFLKYLFFFVCWFFTQQTQAQISFNFNGSAYVYYNVSSSPNSPSNSYDQYIINNNLVAVEPANGAYNCHAFAWANRKDVRVETSGNSSDGPKIYYTSGYYTSTTESDAEIVVYGAGGYPIHSAIRLTNSSNAYAQQYLQQYPQYAGWYISKWDDGPLVIHPLTACPYYDAGSQTVTFYKKSQESSGSNNIRGSNYIITGPKLVCSSPDPIGYNLSYSTGGPVVPIITLRSFTVTWAASSGITVSNSNAYPNKPTSSSSGAGGYMQATLHFPDGTTSNAAAQYAITWKGLPDNISSVSTSQWSGGPGSFTTINVSASSAYFYAWPFNTGDLNYPNPLDPRGVSSYTWSILSQGGPTPTFYQNSATLNYRYAAGSFNNPDYGYATLLLQASNNCGTREYRQNIYVSSSFFLMAPNPASDNVTVTMSEKNSQATNQNAAGNRPGSVAPVTYTLRITDMMGTVYYTAKKTGNKFSIPVSNLKRGNYTLEISDGKTVSSKPLVVSH